MSLTGSIYHPELNGKTLRITCASKSIALKICMAFSSARYLMSSDTGASPYQRLHTMARWLFRKYNG
ncbi:hypothetical protein M407DRAFT_33712 [Tulasnella calospora MUT 4182]|uniref:Uncharacterized protein n=1 Tax=Tulasnella calospora MUT 4182 TaxID=1051891 RepID=A0A0C3PQ39_9AGAM|nr:hypothetical protein M407DRAFT_33712 [Tulasnella calospora MUT 4182]